MLGNWGIYRVFKRELLRLAQQKSVRNLFIIVPLLAFFILGAIYYKGALRELPIAVYDNDNSSMSRTYIRFLEASPTFKITHYISSDEDIERAFVKNDVEAVFYIPKDFYKNVLKKNTGTSKNIQQLYQHCLWKPGIPISGSDKPVAKCFRCHQANGTLGHRPK